ncbi:MAG: hypothetical protein ABI200_00115 [Gaiellales bacterium]
MRVRSASDVMYTTVAWLPMLALVVGVLYVLASGLLHLEMISFGSEFFIGNNETSNLPTPLGGGVSHEEVLLDALNSGDTVQMQAALDQVGNERAQLSGSLVG